MRESLSTLWKGLSAGGQPTIPAHVLDRLAEALVRGCSPKQAAKECSCDDYHELQGLVDAALSMSNSPLLRIARVAYARLESREWLLNAQRQLAGDRVRVDVRPTLSRAEFLRDYYYQNRPVLCPSIASMWPAINRWTPEYLKAAIGDVQVEAMMGRTDAPVHVRAAGNHLRQQVRFGEFVDKAWSSESDDFYLVGANDFFSAEGTSVLAEDIGLLPLARTECGDGAKKLWLGPAGTFTPFHYDSRNNVMVQVVGRKRVFLSPPYASEMMRQQSQWYAGLDPLADHDVDRLPLATIDLSPGDALFLPVGWWHAVQGLTVAITITCIDFGVPNSYDREPTLLMPAGALA